MAFAILQAAIGAANSGDTWDGIPGNETKFTDQFTNNAVFTSSLVTFVGFVRTVRAVIWQKGYTKGTASQGPQYELLVADNSGFTTNVRSVASGVAGRGPTNIYINGVVPDTLLAQWCKLQVTNGPGGTATDSFTFDVDISAA